MELHLQHLSSENRNSMDGPGLGAWGLGLLTHQGWIQALREQHGLAPRSLQPSQDGPRQLLGPGGTGRAWKSD